MILRIIKIKKYIWLKKPDFYKNNRLLSLREKTYIFNIICKNTFVFVEKIIKLIAHFFVSKKLSM